MLVVLHGGEISNLCRKGCETVKLPNVAGYIQGVGKFVWSFRYVIPMYLGIGDIDGKVRERIILKVSKVNLCRA